MSYSCYFLYHLFYRILVIFSYFIVSGIAQFIFSLSNFVNIKTIEKEIEIVYASVWYITRVI